MFVKIFITVILAVSTINFTYSQFLILNQGETAEYFHTLIPQTKSNQFSVLKYREKNVNGKWLGSQILTFNNLGLLVDSVTVPKQYTPISFPIKHNQNYYWSAVLVDTLGNTTNKLDAYILELDTLFRFQNARQLCNNPIGTRGYPTNTIKVGHNLYAAINFNTTNNTIVYKINIQTNKVDSVIYPAFINEILTYDNSIILSAKGFSPQASVGGGAQKVIMDTSLSVIDVFNLDSLTYLESTCSQEISMPFLFSKQMPITPNKTIALGRFNVVYNSNCDTYEALISCVLDTDNKIVRTKIIKDSTQNISYVDNVNYACINNDYLYTVGSENFNSNGQLLQTQNTSILVCKFDTMANLIWKKSYGNNMFYRPVSIISTIDSGLLISGIRYDAINTNYLGVAEGFVLKLDKNGEVLQVGINKNNGLQYDVMLYPNPASSELTIKFYTPFNSPVQLAITNLMGEVVLQQSISSFLEPQTINVKQLANGVYTVSLKHTKGIITRKIVIAN